MTISTINIEAGNHQAPQTLKVWDPLVRIFHWSLVGGFAFAYATADEWDKAHETTGYVIAGLIGFRVLWGLIGPKHARFVDFVTRPSRVLQYLKDSREGKAKRYMGHNPAGGAMVLALLSAITLIAMTGYMMTTKSFWGVEWVEDVHEVLVNGTLVLIITHVAGVVFASREHKENLVLAMITGRKRK